MVLLWRFVLVLSLLVLVMYYQRVSGSPTYTDSKVICKDKCSHPTITPLTTEDSNQSTSKGEHKLMGQTPRDSEEGTVTAQPEFLIQNGEKIIRSRSIRNIEDSAEATPSTITRSFITNIKPLPWKPLTVDNKDDPLYLQCKCSKKSYKIPFLPERLVQQSLSGDGDGLCEKICSVGASKVFNHAGAHVACNFEEPTTYVCYVMSQEVTLTLEEICCIFLVGLGITLMLVGFESWCRFMYGRLRRRRVD